MEGDHDVVEVRPRQFRIQLELKRKMPFRLSLNNKVEQKVAFKVKTTSPARYLVKPTHGFINPLQNKDVQITLLPMDEYPDPGNLDKAKGLKDKFLVQTMTVPDGPMDLNDLQSLWKSKEKAHDPKRGKAQYCEVKIKCRLTLPAPQRAEMASARGFAEQASFDNAAAVLPTHEVPAVPTESTNPGSVTFADTKVPTSTDADQAMQKAHQVIEGANSPRHNMQGVQVSDKEKLEMKEAEFKELLDFVVQLTAATEKVKEGDRMLRRKLHKVLEDKKQLEIELQNAHEELATQGGSPSEGLRLRNSEKRNGRDSEQEEGTSVSSSDASSSNLRMEWWQGFLVAIIFFVLGRIMS